MSYLIIFAIISLLIFVHELGHYAAARVLGIPVARFSMGIGRKVWAFSWGATEYRLSLVPFGGYVLPAHDSFFSQTPVARLLFALGGPAANVALTFALSAAFNVAFHGFSWAAVLEAPVQQTWNAFELVLRALPAVLTGGHEAVGPLGVFSEGGAFVGSSFLLALQFGAVLSMNLAVINMLPVPPLDGGRVVLVVLEMLWERASRLQVPLNVAGFLAVLGFVSWLTMMDLRRLLARFFV